jgi:PAS domain S-box-containing protein
MANLVHSEFHESEEGYRLLFESNPHPMWIYDRESLAFLAVNDAAVQNYGYSQDEFRSMSVKDIRPPEDIPWLLEKIAEIKPGMNSASSRHLKKDGTLLKVEIVSHTLQFDGRHAELVLALPLRTEDRGPTASNAIGSFDYTSLHFEDAQLTDAEKRVAVYVARGYANKQIAQLLRISVRTVENHISHILIKKRFENRVQIARHVLRTATPPRS